MLFRSVWGRDALTRYDPDALRYYLTVNMPETKDSDWDWAEFVARNNNELVATWGNLANRVLAFCYKNWEGYVPSFESRDGVPPSEDANQQQGAETAPLRDADLKLLETIENGFNQLFRQKAKETKGIRIL